MRPNGKRVLVVDDDNDVCALVADSLRSTGYGVAACDTPAAALNLLKRSPTPDVMVVDLWMPEMSGPELIDAVRADPRHRKVPVVILSAVVNAEIAQSLQAVAFLRKPFQVPDLYATIERLTEDNPV
jgi:CheY-like chemotaxis protein